MKRNSRRGFTLIEMTIALIVLSVMILASGSILVFLARGQKESDDDNTAQNRLELVRELMVGDFRTGRLIVSPSTSGGTGTVVEVEIIDYKASTDVTTVKRIRWFYDSGTSTMTRMSSSETSSGSGTFTTAVSTFTQSSITAFSVTRYNDGDGDVTTDKRLDFTMSTTQGTQGATIGYAVICRNVN